jgi:hypothetical protein
MYPAKVMPVMCASSEPEFVRVNVWAAGAGPLHAPPPKSSVAVGQPVTLPVPPCPENESEETLVPQTAPVTVNVDVAVDAVVVVGVKPAWSTELPEAGTVALVGDSENWEFDGVPKATEAGALPVFWRVSPIAVAAWLSG